MKPNIFYTLRSLIKRPTNSIISIVGLSVAIACCLIIYFFAEQEFSYNKFHTNADRIYRIDYSLKYFSGREFKTVRLSKELPEKLKEEIPQIEKATFYRYSFDREYKFNDDYYKVNTAIGNKDFFEIFSFEFLLGSKTEALSNPYQIAITKSFADRIISNEKYDSLIGKTISLPIEYSDKPFTITGILKDIPENSSIHFEAILSNDEMNRLGGCSNWIGNGAIYYMTDKKSNPFEVKEQVVKVVKNFYEDRISELKRSKVLVDKQDAFSPSVTSLNDLYFTYDISDCNANTSNKRSLIILITVGLIILTIAFSNYIMFQIAQNYKKVNEFGVRKTLGANRWSVHSIFFSEGFVITAISFILGMILSLILIPVFNQISESQIYIDLVNFPMIVFKCALGLLLLVFLTSIASMFSFTGIQTTNLLKRMTNKPNKNSRLQSFVAFQYGLSIVMIILSVFIVRQANYLKNKSLGLNTNNILCIQLENLDNDQKNLLYDKLSSRSEVNQIARSSRNFISNRWNDFIENESGEMILVDNIRIDDQYIPTLGLNMIMGNNFTRENLNRTDNNIIVNEEFIKQFNIKDNPLGKSYRFAGSNFTIIGVVNDFNFLDATEKIAPALLYARTSFSSYNSMFIRYNPETLSDMLDYIRTIPDEIAPGKEISYLFWDEELGKRYEEEEKWSKIITNAAVIAIVISSLGLFGLTILLINQRIKEIGIRKVNGAKISEVLVTLLKSFAIWLIGAFIITAPIASIIVNKWLEKYPYKIETSWWVFLLAGILAMILALFTIGFQSYQAARRNPVEALRYE